jgi:DNA-binding NtrC family response regulator
MEPLKVLLLDDEAIVGKRLGMALSKHGLAVEVFEDPNQAVAPINETEFDIVVSDVRMEAMDGLKVLEAVMAKSTRTKVIIITGYATVEIA